MIKKFTVKTETPVKTITNGLKLHSFFKIRIGGKVYGTILKVLSENKALSFYIVNIIRPLPKDFIEGEHFAIFSDNADRRTNSVVGLYESFIFATNKEDFMFFTSISGDTIDDYVKKYLDIPKFHLHYSKKCINNPISIAEQYPRKKQGVVEKEKTMEDLLPEFTEAEVVFDKEDTFIEITKIETEAFALGASGILGNRFLKITVGNVVHGTILRKLDNEKKELTFIIDLRKPLPKTDRKDLAIFKRSLGNGNLIKEGLLLSYLSPIDESSYDELVRFPLQC